MVLIGKNIQRLSYKSRTFASNRKIFGSYSVAGNKINLKILKHAGCFKGGGVWFAFTSTVKAAGFFWSVDALNARCFLSSILNSG